MSGNRTTPSPNSPVGKLIPVIMEKNPDFNYESARAEANNLLERAAGRKNYKFPKVLSLQEQEEARQRLKAAFHGRSGA